MRNYLKLGVFLLAITLYSCGGGNEKADKSKEETAITNPNSNPNATASTDAAEGNAAKEEEAPLPPSKQIRLEDKGTGPITNVDLAETIDQDLVAKGKELYNANCTACHKPHEDYLGPAQAGILDRRSPEWVMNMILDPGTMEKEEPFIKELQEQFHGQLMTDQGLTKEEARAILEYFRTLEAKS